MNLQIDLTNLETQIKQIVTSAIPQREYIGFADVEEFIKISGISDNDLEKKVFPDKDFQQFVFRFGRGNKRYVKVQPALEYIERNLMIKESEI